MKFLGYTMTMRGLETVAERFGQSRPPDTDIDLRRATVADARKAALDAETVAAEAEGVLEVKREEVALARARRDAKRERLRQQAHDAREAALDAPTRRIALEQDAIAERAELDIAELDGEDHAAEAGLEPFELRALARRRIAHHQRQWALRVLQDAAYADVQLEIRIAQAGKQDIEREFKRRGRSWADYE